MSIAGVLASRADVVAQRLFERCQLEIQRLAERCRVDAVVMLQDVEHGKADRRVPQQSSDESDAQPGEAERNARDARFVAMESRGAQHEIAMGQAFGTAGVESEIPPGGRDACRENGGHDVSRIDRLLQRAPTADQSKARRLRLVAERRGGRVVTAEDHRHPDHRRRDPIVEQITSNVLERLG